MSDSTQVSDLYLYQPSHVLPAVFAVLVGLSLIGHVYQNIRYRAWRMMFFMVWAGMVFTAGWVMRIVSSYHTSNLNYYISQSVLIIAGPPIYSAAEYNVLGRLMHYLPMHAPLHPHRVVTVFVYLGATVESLTAAGATLMATNPGDLDIARRGGTLLSIALVLQAVVELVFMSLVVTIHLRCNRARSLPPRVRTLCFMLYGTSTLIFIRCVARAIESFGEYNSIGGECTGICHVVTRSEWYLYVFEAAPMVVYTYWLNIIHPGRLLPRDRMVFLDVDGLTERRGPGWIDHRSKWETFTDPLDVSGMIKGQANHEKFWLRPDDWPVYDSGASTARQKGLIYRQLQQKDPA